MSQPIEYETTNVLGHISTTVNGKLHSINDQPAEIWTCGSKLWYNNGKLHRDNDLPAEIDATGDQIWYYHGKKHRDNDQPAEINKDGDQYWYINGKKHRDNDKPAIVCANGDQYWFIDGVRHRDNDKPAIVCQQQYQFWYINGLKHRDNGKPAEIWADGTQRWYINSVLQPEPTVDCCAVSFTVNKYAVDCGIITQKINIYNSGKTTVNHMLELANQTTVCHTIDIKVKDLNNITKMRVVNGDITSVDAMVNGEWVNSKPHES